MARSTVHKRRPSWLTRSRVRCRGCGCVRGCGRWLERGPDGAGCNRRQGLQPRPIASSRLDQDWRADRAAARGCEAFECFPSNRLCAGAVGLDQRRHGTYCSSDCGSSRDRVMRTGRPQTFPDRLPNLNTRVRLQSSVNVRLFECGDRCSNDNCRQPVLVAPKGPRNRRSTCSKRWS